MPAGWPACWAASASRSSAGRPGSWARWAGCWTATRTGRWWTTWAGCSAGCWAGGADRLARVAAIALQQPAGGVEGNRLDLPAPALHRRRHEDRVVDGLLGGLDHRLEEPPHLLVRYLRRLQ